ncbi:hypothetical protein F4804DRAFT_315973 [Jackrogersella minutella]|nr:hypothetical protein F4804DRAFT_315973 [Jackrogersella minutella]
MAMATAVQVMHSSKSSNRQQAPSTALVLDFACLFTRDLRRKQKRWQDGRLKYHTFNKRIMVYDERGNFIGDTHWREDYDLNDGDEVDLERGGVIVQVAECTGSRDQDLSELVDKRAQEKAERHAAALARRHPTLEAAASPHAAAPHVQLRHKPLHNLIGTPTGHHGRALMPSESPYEERQKMVTSPQNENARPAKRRKREVSPPSKGGYAQSLFGAALSLSATPTSTPLIRNRPPKATPVLVDSPSPVSPEAIHHDGNSDSTLVLTHSINTDIQRGAHADAPRTALLSKVSRAQRTLGRDMDVAQSSSFPLGTAVESGEQHNSTRSTKGLGLKRREETRNRVIGSDSLHLGSVNLSSGDREMEELNTPQLKGTRNVVNEASVAVALTKEVENTPKARSKKSVRSRGLAAVPKLVDKPKTSVQNNERRESAQEQPTDEPRTELRIRPRKKRGLLMVSENLETSKSSSTARKKRSGCQESSASLDDIAIEHSNRDVLDGESLDIEIRENNHPQRKKQKDIHSIGGVDTRSSSMARTNSHSSKDIENHGHNLTDLDTGQSLPKQGSSGAEPKPSRSASLTKSKSRDRRNTETRSDRRKVITDRESITTLDMPGLVGRDESPGDMEPHTRSMECDRRTMEPEPVPEDTVLSKTTDSPRRRKQPSRKIKKSTKDTADPSSTASKYDKKQEVSDEENIFLPNNVPPPRLAHLGRRNIRSREVIGLNFDEEPNRYSVPPRIGGGSECGKGGLASDLPANHLGMRSTTSSANRTDMAARRSDRANANDRGQDHGPRKEKEKVESHPIPRSIECPDTATIHAETNSHVPQKQIRSRSIRANEDLDVQTLVPEDITAPPQPPSRIVANPATRGKKAAKPSDAAGQVPQCPLPLEAAVGLPLNSGKLENEKRKSRLEGRSKETTIKPMAGFVRANGGPWSREAHDLFEFTRPP